MDKPTNKYSELFKIRASEVNEEATSTIPAICSLFQEVAGNHALTLNFDITQLHEQNLTWVLHRMNIKMKRYPKWREKVTIETWPAAGDALRAYRDYDIIDENKESIGCCLSYWMMINLKTRRPTRMPKEVLELRLENVDHVMEIKSNRLVPIEKIDAEKNFQVRNSDLDMNHHVNNTKYLEWMIETIPENITKKISEVDIIFLREGLYQDKIRSLVELKEEHISHHQLINQDGETIALATFSFV